MNRRPRNKSRGLANSLSDGSSDSSPSDPTYAPPSRKTTKKTGKTKKTGRRAAPVVSYEKIKIFVEAAKNRVIEDSQLDYVFMKNMHDRWALNLYGVCLVGDRPVSLESRLALLEYSTFLREVSFAVWPLCPSCGEDRQGDRRESVDAICEPCYERQKAQTDSNSYYFSAELKAIYP